jgi:hypothetical protein
MSVLVFRLVMPCALVSESLNMEEICSSKTLFPAYKSTWHQAQKTKTDRFFLVKMYWLGISDQWMVWWVSFWIQLPCYNFQWFYNNVYFSSQASELEVLQAVLKWGEHELIRRMEDRGQYTLLNVCFYFDYYADWSYTKCVCMVQNPICWVTQLTLWRGRVLRSEIWVMWSCVRFFQSCCPWWEWIMSCQQTVMYWIRLFDEDW